MADNGELGLRVVVPAGLGLLGLLTLYKSITMPNPLHQPLGPGLVPMILSICIVVGCLADMIPAWFRFSAWRKAHAGSGAELASAVAEADEKTVYPFPSRLGRFLNFLGTNRDWILCTVGLFLGVEVWALFGFIPGAVVSTFAVVLVDRMMKFRTMLLYTAGMVLATWLIFVVGFKVPLD